MYTAVLHMLYSSFRWGLLGCVGRATKRLKTTDLERFGRVQEAVKKEGAKMLYITKIKKFFSNS